MSYLKQAFELTVSDAKVPEQWYVTLIEHVPYYGGPEEGGWWGTDHIVVAYKCYPSEELASSVVEAVKALAKELEADAQREYGQQCLREMEWLEARGLDADWLPEPDGPSTYSVSVTDSIVENAFGERQYS